VGLRNLIGVQVFLFVLLQHSLKAQNEYYFFNPKIDYGSIGSANPINLIVNDGFEMLGIYSPNRQFSKINFVEKSKYLYNRFKDPLRDLKAYGFYNLVNDEIIPFNPKKTNLGFFPNYTAHLFAGGYFYAYLSEYYHYHNFKYPKLMAFTTVYIKNIVNEVIETPLDYDTKIGHLTDLLFWDALAIVAFSSETVKHFFSNTLSVSNWSPIPVISPTTRLSNLNNFITIQRAKKTMRFEPVLMLGLGVMGGLSYEINKTHSISFLGGSLTQFVYKRYGANNILVESVTTREALGLFLDKNNSLMASVIVKRDKNQFLKLNIFPGLFYKELGAYIELGKNPILGITFQTLGFGISN